MITQRAKFGSTKSALISTYGETPDAVRAVSGIVVCTIMLEK
jgi:hypothetical protein